MGATRDRIRQLNDRKVIKLAIPQWGCDVFVREMSAAQRDVYETHYVDRKENGKDQTRAMLAAMVLVEEDGSPWYDSVGDGIAELMNKNGDALDIIWRAVILENKFGEAGALDVAKNSEGDQPAS